MAINWNNYEIYVLTLINAYKPYFTFSLNEICNMFHNDTQCNNRTTYALKNKIYRLQQNNFLVVDMSKEKFIPNIVLNIIKKQPRTIIEMATDINLPELFVYECVRYLIQNNLPIRITESGHVVYNTIKTLSNDNHVKKNTSYIKYKNNSKIIFGVVTDTHMGSKAYNGEALEKFYTHCDNLGITTILHAGDILDGVKVYKGQEYEQEYYGFDAQTKFAIEKYPYKKNITTYAILGNHDYSFISYCDCDPLDKICNSREDIKYVGKYFGEVQLGEYLIALHHPDSGLSYALSYKPQKILEAVKTYYDGYIIGHYHTSLSLYDYHSRWACLAGSFQNETMFARRKGLRNTIGGYVVSMEKLEDGGVCVTPMWINY